MSTTVFSVLPVSSQDTTTVTLSLPETVVVHQSGTQKLAPCVITMSVPHHESGGLSNALALLDVLYTHAVTTPAELAFLLRLTGRQAVPGPSQSLSTSPSPQSLARPDRQE